uniref:SFRICE_006717 n=1 Tax=Spodoptera frugiperda TaxID=7108 RepID=A0A2H1VJX7_SPOFR
MAPKKCSKNRIVAKIVTGKREPCGFCQREVDDELTYGKLYAIGEIQCHYFCVLLSSCLIQRGKDMDGLFGFLYEDIIKEIQRAKKHKCSYCNRAGANLGCSVSQCKKQFHLPCGRERNAVSMFYGNYKSFCQSHAPKQNITPAIMANAKLRMQRDNRNKKKISNFKDLKELSICTGDQAPESDTQSVCVICYEAVDGYPTVNTFWPPCCARDAWFHRSCLQRMALSAGMHYLKCPLCNDKDNFYQAVVTQGYYVPDRDAAWELEQNAFSEIYEREVPCSAADCKCPMGRSHDADNGSWYIKLCLLCGSSGVHNACTDNARVHGACTDSSRVHVCTDCTPAAPDCIEELASCIEAVISQEQQQTSSRSRRGPVMPSRMSLRRTKRNASQNMPSCSSAGNTEIKQEVKPEPQTNTSLSRQELNLKPPKIQETNILETLLNQKPYPGKESPNKMEMDTYEYKYQSPMKMLEESLRVKMKNLGAKNVILDEKTVEGLRMKFRKPKPLREKRKIVNDILNEVFDNLLKEPKQKDPVIQWSSPKKYDTTPEVIEIVDNTPPSVTDKENTKTPIKQEVNSEQDTYITPRKRPDLDLATKPITDKETHIIRYPTYKSPNKLKTVDILKNSSLEISAQDEMVNIDVIKIENNENEHFIKKLGLKSPEKSEKCAFKFSPYNKEVLESQNIDIDVESFKDQYLNEVGLQRAKKETIKQEETVKKSSKKCRKRKLNDEFVLKLESKKRKKTRKDISIKDKNIKVKIRWRDEELKVQIKDTNKIKKSKKYRQYILECSPENCSSVKPEKEITPLRRKYKKQDKSPDNLIQTSIQKFFKVKSND